MIKFFRYIYILGENKIMRDSKINKLIDDIYVELYSVAECIDGKRYSWKSVVDAVRNFESDIVIRKIIPFYAFFVDVDVFDTIVEAKLKRKHHYTKCSVEFNVYLGPSPISCEDMFKSLKDKYNNYISKVTSEMSIEEVAELTGEPVYSSLNVALKILPTIVD